MLLLLLSTRSSSSSSVFSSDIIDFILSFYVVLLGSLGEICGLTLHDSCLSLMPLDYLIAFISAQFTIELTPVSFCLSLISDTILFISANRFSIESLDWVALSQYCEAFLFFGKFSYWGDAIIVSLFTSSTTIILIEASLFLISSSPCLQLSIYSLCTLFSASSFWIFSIKSLFGVSTVLRLDFQIFAIFAWAFH